MTQTKAKTKAAQTALPRYRNMPTSKRMAAAVELVMSGKETQAEAARMTGVSRPRLNINVKQARERLAAQQERSAATGAERRGETPVMVDSTGAEVIRERDRSERFPTFAEFERLYFSQLECFDCGVHHDTPDFHIEMMDKITDPAIKRLLINVPPGHSKSTVGTVKSTVYELCRDPNSITAVVSKSQKLAEKFLYSMGRYLTDPDLYRDTPRNLIDDWGPFITGTGASAKLGAADRFYVAGRQTAEKDPSVSAYGVGGHIYGIRAHRMIMDDIADLENQQNQQRVLEMLAWCTQEAGSRVGRHGKLIFIGTRVHPNDIYSHLQNLPGYSVIRYPCIMSDDTELTLWPEHFDYKAAKLQRDSMSSEQWQLVYQNIDTPGFGASFPPEVVEGCYDPERPLGHYDPSWALIVGIDPAGANAQAGHTAFILWGVDLTTGVRHLVDLVNAKQMKAPQMRDQLFDWAERYPIREVRVESNGLQALHVATEIPTPTGWTTMGGLAVGDEVFAPDGSVTVVTAKSDEQINATYEVAFNDGTKLLADAGHRWFVGRASNGRERFEWTTTADLATALARPSAARRYVPVAAPLDLPPAELPIDPYLLGAWLGDGSTDSASFAASHKNGDQDFQRAMLSALGYEWRGGYVDPHKTYVPRLRQPLADAGLLGHKHVPDAYLRSSVAQRLALLQGLMDTDGTISRSGRASFANKNQRLIAAVAELATSLGWKVFVRHEPLISKVYFTPKKGDLTPFRLQRKIARIREHNGTSKSVTRRHLVSVTPVDPVPVSCITVAHPSSQFLAGRQMVATGNSQLFQYNQEIMARMTNKGIRVVPHVTTGRNKWDPQFGVEAMSTLFVNRMVSLPTLNVESRNRIRMLTDQLISFPMSSKTDLVMALWFAELGAKDIVSRAAIPMFDPRFKAPARIMKSRRIFDFGDKTVRRPTAESLGVGRQMFPPGQQPEDPKFVNVEGSVRTHMLSA